MAIKNYTTKVDVFVSIGEIQASLARHGARKIIIDYDADAQPVSVSFAMETRFGAQGFTLPAMIEGTQEVFAQQRIKADKRQAAMTAWRNIRDWVLAQMALVESCSVPVEQIFLPYLVDNNGRTLYAAYCSGQLALANSDCD